jgi:VanZ family protein
VRRAELLKYWGPAILWSVVLLLMSGSAGSSSVTGRVLAFFLSPASPAFDPLHFLIRKTIHVVAYGLLGALDFRAVRGARRGWRPAWSAVAVVLAVAIASLDEYHQSFFASRTGVPSDVVIDACGATLAQLVCYRFS